MIGDIAGITSADARRISTNPVFRAYATLRGVGVIADAAALVGVVVALASFSAHFALLGLAWLVLARSVAPWWGAPLAVRAVSTLGMTRAIGVIVGIYAVAGLTLTAAPEVIIAIITPALLAGAASLRAAIGTSWGVSRLGIGDQARGRVMGWILTALCVVAAMLLLFLGFAVVSIMADPAWRVSAQIAGIFTLVAAGVGALGVMMLERLPGSGPFTRSTPAPPKSSPRDIAALRALAEFTQHTHRAPMVVAVLGAATLGVLVTLVSLYGGATHGTWATPLLVLAAGVGMGAGVALQPRLPALGAASVYAGVASGLVLTAAALVVPVFIVTWVLALCGAAVLAASLRTAAPLLHTHALGIVVWRLAPVGAVVVSVAAALVAVGLGAVGVATAVVVGGALVVGTVVVGLAHRGDDDAPELVWREPQGADVAHIDQGATVEAGGEHLPDLVDAELVDDEETIIVASNDQQPGTDEQRDDIVDVEPLRDTGEVTGMSGSDDVSPAGAARFIVIEGGDGSGKSTTLAAIADALAERSELDVVTTRQPGGTEQGKQLRELLLGDAQWSPRAEALLFAADRAQHVDEVITPALERGAIVLCDRYIDSSLAYQAGGRALQARDIERISRWAAGDLEADLTIVLDIDPEVARERRGADAERDGEDRMESAGDEFHAAVRDVFLQRAAAHPDSYVVIDASADADTVCEQAVRAVCERVGIEPADEADAAAEAEADEPVESPADPDAGDGGSGQGLAETVTSDWFAEPEGSLTEQTQVLPSTRPQGEESVDTGVPQGREVRESDGGQWFADPEGDFTPDQSTTVLRGDADLIDLRSNEGAENATVADQSAENVEAIVDVRPEEWAKERLSFAQVWGEESTAVRGKRLPGDDVSDPADSRAAFTTTAAIPQGWTFEPATDYLVPDDAAQPNEWEAADIDPDVPPVARTYPTPPAAVDEESSLPLSRPAAAWRKFRSRRRDERLDNEHGAAAGSTKPLTPPVTNAAARAQRTATRRQQFAAAERARRARLGQTEQNTAPTSAAPDGPKRNPANDKGTWFFEGKFDDTGSVNRGENLS